MPTATTTVTPVFPPQGQVQTNDIERKTCTCPICGNEKPEDRFVEVNRDGEKIRICRDCRYLKAYVCGVCGELHIDDAITITLSGFGTYSTRVCKKCRDTRITTCPRCNRNVVKDGPCESVSRISKKRYCLYCATLDGHDEFPDVIRPYGYKPNPVFFPAAQKRFYLGIELEVSGIRERDNRKCLGQVADCFETGYVYGKHDGSVPNGFELVTEPATLDYIFSHKANWEKAFETFKSFGGISGHIDTGLHIHVSRSRFTNNDMLARTIYLFDKFYNQICKVSKRRISRAERWAGKSLCWNERVPVMEMRNYQLYAQNGSSGRYMAVNLSNRNTVEFRIFASTLEWDIFASCVELLDLILKTAETSSNSKVLNMSFYDMCENSEGELRKRLKYARLLTHPRSATTESKTFVSTTSATTFQIVA